MTDKTQTLPLTALILLELLAAIDVSGVTVLVPTLQEHFSLGPSRAAWVLSAYLLPFSVFIIPVGVISDRLNIPKKMLRWCTLGFALGSMACAVSGNIWMFFIARAFKGVCAAGIFTSQFTIILKYWRNPHRAVEIALTGMAVGLFVGPLLGAWTAHAVVWRFFFGAGAVVALMAVAFSVAIDRMTPVQGEERRSPGEEAYLSFAESVRNIFKVGAWGFILHFVLSFAMAGANLVITIHLQQTVNASPEVNGWALAIVAAGMASQNIAGLGSRFFKTVDQAAVIGLICLGGLLAVLSMSASLCDTTAFIIYFFLGMALGLALSAVDIVILEKVPVQRLAFTTALATMVMQGAMALSVACMPALYWQYGKIILAYVGILCVMAGGIAGTWKLHVLFGNRRS